MGAVCGMSKDDRAQQQFREEIEIVLLRAADAVRMGDADPMDAVADMMRELIDCGRWLPDRSDWTGNRGRNRPESHQFPAGHNKV